LSPLQETFILLDRLNKTILAVSLFILVIVLWIAYLLARSVTAPVSALGAKRFLQIAGGDYGIRVSIRTGDELEILGNEIHEMAATIRRRNEEIQDYIKQIEEWNQNWKTR
jgi:nitrogen fixation/metabolism regulation signal transduction histidine kinase